MVEALKRYLISEKDAEIQQLKNKILDKDEELKKYKENLERYNLKM